MISVADTILKAWSDACDIVRDAWPEVEYIIIAMFAFIIIICGLYWITLI